MGNQQKFGRRTKSPPGFAMIDADVLKSAAWQQLNGSAVKLYVYMRSKTYGPLVSAVKNPLKLSYETMKSGTGLSQQTIRDSLIILENIGFIDFTKHGGLKSGGLSCNEYKMSQRYLKYNSPLFQAGAERKHPGYKGRGFTGVWEVKAQKADIENRPAQSKSYISDTQIN